MNHEDYKDLLPLAALDSLDAADARALQDHLATCEECRRELTEWRDDIALFALSVDHITPPETLRARILESLKEADVTNTFSQPQTNAATNANSETSEETGKVLPLRRGNNAGGEKTFFGKSALWSGALAASLVAALIIALVVLWQRDNAKQEEQARLSTQKSNGEKQAEPNQSLPRNAENNETNAEKTPSSNNNNEATVLTNGLPKRNSPSRSDNDNQQDKKTEQPKVITPSANQPQVIESPITESPVTESTPSVTDTQVVQLSGTAKAPQAHASLVLDESAGKITVTVSNLPPPAAGKAYQLWFMVKGQPIPGTVFVTGREGRAMIHGQIPVRARGASAFAITLEESNGANKPTGAKYLLGSITTS